jgi:hypothetical protein
MKQGGTMKKTMLTGYVMALLVTLSMAYAQSLGELADKEKQRRQEIQNEKVITNKEAEQYKSETSDAPSVPDLLPEKEEGTDTEKEAPDANPSAQEDSDEPVDMQGKTESYWRKTMMEARQQLTGLDNEAKALALKVTDLQNKLTGIGLDGAGDGFRKEAIQRELQKTYYEQDVNKKTLAKAQAALQDLENEARKSGALPGWLENSQR